MQLLLLVILLGGVGMFVLFYGMRLKAARVERIAALYEKAIDQGLDPREISFQLDESELGDPYGNLKAGIILLATALAIVLAIWAVDRLHGPYKSLGFGLIPAAIGLACIYIHFAIPRTPPAGGNPHPPRQSDS
jgi:hypothetical protein